MTTRGLTDGESSLRRVAPASAPPTVGHFLNRRSATRRLEQRLRQLLLLLDHRLEEIALLLDALQNLRRVEHEPAWGLRLEAFLHLVPRHRLRDFRPPPGARRG